MGRVKVTSRRLEIGVRHVGVRLRRIGDVEFGSARRIAARCAAVLGQRLGTVGDGERRHFVRVRADEITGTSFCFPFAKDLISSETPKAVDRGRGAELCDPASLLKTSTIFVRHGAHGLERIRCAERRAKAAPSSADG